MHGSTPALLIPPNANLAPHITILDQVSPIPNTHIPDPPLTRSLLRMYKMLLEKRLHPITIAFNMGTGQKPIASALSLVSGGRFKLWASYCWWRPSEVVLGQALLSIDQYAVGSPPAAGSGSTTGEIGSEFRVRGAAEISD